MPLRFHVAAVLYPIVQSLLFGCGVVAVALLPYGEATVLSLTHCALASLVLAFPLAWEAAPLLMSAKERVGLDKPNR